MRKNKPGTIYKDIVIVGMGALGTRVARNLLGSGLRRIRLIDRDYVDEKNLKTQTLYSLKDIGMPKALAARENLKNSFPDASISISVDELDSSNIDALCSNAGIIIGVTDNFESRFVLNAYAARKGISFIHGAASREAGCTYLYTKDSPCIYCIYHDKDGEGCEESNILQETADKVSSEIGRLITSPEAGILGCFNQGRSYKITPGFLEGCQVCKGLYIPLKRPIRMCGGEFHFRLNEHQKRLIVHTPEYTLFRDGRIIVRAKTEDEAKAIIKGRFPGFS